MRVTRQQFERLNATLYAARDAALEKTGGGSYVIRLETASTSHMDFSDLSFLGAKDSSDAENRAAVLAVIRSYTLAFFDQTLRGERSSLLEGGGKENVCGWLKDRFGVSWQVVPSLLPRLMGDPNPRKAAAVSAAMMKMVKLDAAKLQAAYDAA